MAFCPKCNGEMDVIAKACPHCGYDFALPPVFTSDEPGIIYSGLADVALTISSIAAGLGCIGAIIVAIRALTRSHLFEAFVLCPIAFFLQLGMLVVFERVRRIK